MTFLLFQQVVDDAVNHVNEAEGEAKHEVEQVLLSVFFGLLHKSLLV